MTFVLWPVASCSGQSATFTRRFGRMQRLISYTNLQALFLSPVWKSYSGFHVAPYLHMHDTFMELVEFMHLLENLSTGGGLHAGTGYSRIDE